MKLKYKENSSDNQWIAISDMMTVLMLIFLIIAIGYMINIQIEKEKI